MRTADDDRSDQVRQRRRSGGDRRDLRRRYREGGSGWDANTDERRAGRDPMRRGPHDRERLFDEWADSYDDAVASSAHPFPWGGYDLVLDEIMKQAAISPGMSVLDLGIGTGNLAARFAALGCSVWGADFSLQMLAQARAKLPEAVLIQADLLGEWPGALEQRFDRIVSAYVLHEFDLAAKLGLLQRAAAHLAPEGRLVIGDIAFSTVDQREAAHARWPERWDDEEHYWAADEVISACREMGLAVAYAQVSPCGGVFVVANAHVTHRGE